MGDVSRDNLRAILLAREITPWTSECSYTEQSPIPGYPVPGRATDLRLIASGTPTGTTALEVRCQHAGTPGQVDHGPSMACRRLGEPLYQGSEQPGALAGWEQIDFAKGDRPSITSIGTILVAAVEDGVQIRIYTRALGAASWTDRGVLPGYAAWLAYPWLMMIGTDIYCLAWRSAASWSGAVVTAIRRYIGVWRSVDSGVTWTLVQDFATIERDTYDDTVTPSGTGGIFSCGRIEAAYIDGQVSVFAHLRERKLNGDLDWVRQWCGASLIARLDLVGTYQGSGGVGWGLPSVTATPTGFVVAWLARSGGSVGAHVARIGSAWQPITTASSVIVAGPYAILPAGGWSAVGAGTAKTYEDNDAAECAVAWDPAGVLWLLLCASEVAIGAGNQYAYYSPDGGTTWTPGHGTIPAVTDVSGCWYWPHDTGAAGVGGTQGHRPNQVRACWHLGRLAAAHVGYSTTAGCTAAVAYLGGWSDLTLPYEQDGAKLGDRVGWLRAVLPIEVAASGDYTVATAGTFTRSIVTPGYEHHTTGDGGGATGQDFCTWVGVDNGGQMHGDAEWQAGVVQGGSSVQAEIGLRMRLASPTHGCEVEVCHTSTGIYVRDYVAGAALGSAVGLTPGALYQVRLGMAMTSDAGTGRGVQVWYRAMDREPNRRWTRIGAWTLQDDAGGGGITPWVKWLHIVAGGNVTQNQSNWIGPWMTIPYSAVGTAAGTHATWHDLNQTGGDNPGKLPGRPLGTAAIWALDGVTLAGRHGPGLIGDTWTSTPTGEYSLARGLDLITPSPRIPWRTVGLVANAVIAWANDPDNPGVEDCAQPPLLGIHFAGFNARRVKLESKAAGGAWTSRLATSTAILSSVAFARLGNVAEPGDAVSTLYFHRDELAGFYVQLDNGAGTVRRRKVQGNDEGRWSNAGTEPMCRIYLDNMVTTDPVGGAGQSLLLWPDQFTGIIRGVDCTAWRLTLEIAYPTFEGDFRAKIFFGPVHIFGLEPSWGRGIEQEAGHEFPEMEGRIGVRVDRSPPRRVITVAWEDGVDTSEIYASAVVRYVTPSTAALTEPNAALAATPGSLLHALRRHGGRPAVYLPRIPRTAATTWTMTRRDEHLLATIATGPTLQPFLGDELQDEVQRVASIEMLEVR